MKLKNVLYLFIYDDDIFIIIFFYIVNNNNCINPHKKQFEL